MGDEEQVITEQVQEPVVEPEVVTPPPDKEPGGDTSADTYERKEYRTRKRVEQELEAERIRIARLEGENQALRQQQQEKPRTEEKVFTIAEVNAAVEQNQISRADADRYIDQVIIPKKIDERLRAREAEVKQQQPIQRAEQDIEEYKAYLPFLRNPNDPQFLRVADQYKKLISEGYPNNLLTEKLAVRLTYGDLDALKRKAEVEAATRNRGANLMPSDSGAGGPKPAANGKVDLSKAPAHLVNYWNRTGTSEKDREAEMAYWVKRQSK